MQGYRSTSIEVELAAASAHAPDTHPTNAARAATLPELAGSEADAPAAWPFSRVACGDIRHGTLIVSDEGYKHSGRDGLPAARSYTAALVAGTFSLLLVFHAFGHDRYAEGSRHLQYGRDQLAIFTVHRRAIDKTLDDFKDNRLEIPQIASIRIARPEVVYRNVHAEIFSLPNAMWLGAVSGGGKGLLVAQSV